ncbi:MAG TPA: TAT-variant-translocated molybdopterin oxidoreductase [Puia sp.]|uniref:TAT-variant-translocated molybdopterin oxidoreductase n=1 Tax=Puia sp. TaxID=2045100 RepID=UPI002C24B018|nr:TAT-variant-translocated molybdopterin oxidoreductase [Puia sp.]HVU97149.1 TAT-variant-translocated molybdopterin oxidoreductase [Puia sp.]
MSDKKYWQSFGERNNSEAFQKSKSEGNEFNESLPLEGLDDKGLLDAKHPRRDFLKYLGFSTAAATLAASCEMPVRHVVPYLNKPDNLIPGVADYYATTYVNGGDVVSVVAKVRDGRPIKLEGNTLSSLTKGGTSARVQASVLDLYDMARLRFPVQMTDGKPNEVSTFEAFDKMVGDALTSAGGPVVLLTSTLTSPTTKQIITEFLAKYPGSRHVQYDADTYSGMLLANEATYGKRAIPTYRFDNAKVVVSLGADFLGTWLTPVEFARQWSTNRKVSAKNPEMSKHYQFESLLSMTGGSADQRFTHRPTETGAIALALLAELGGSGVGSVPAPALSDKLKAGVRKVAKDLMDNKGKALVVCGSNNPNIQIVVNAINEAIGAGGSTITWGAPIQVRQGIDSEMNTLVADLNDDKVGALLVYGVNPAYDYYDAEKFKAGLKKVKVSVSFNDRLDETTELTKYVLPAPHFLESWGDAEPRTGYFSFIQPTIAPLFKTRPFQDSLLKWTGNNTTYEDYLKKYWIGKLGSVEAWEKALQDGVVEPATEPTANVSFSNAKLADAAGAISSIKKGGKFEIVLYQKVTMGTGAQANNPWLQEVPDPVTKADWDNYAVVSPKFAKDTWNLDLGDRRQADGYEVFPTKQVIKVKAGNKELSLPAVIIPGTNNEVIGIAVGYGRNSANPENTADFIGKAAAGVGQNAFPLRTFNGTTVDWHFADGDFEKTKDTFKVAQTQTHNTYEGRTEVVKELTLDTFKKEPAFVKNEREEELKPFGGIEKFEEQGTLYPIYDKPGIKWGMSIDLNSCTGCSACVVACYAENNVPIVGKSEVLRYHDMHWLRIDRYYTTPSNNLDSAEDVQVIFQPMLCQHCDNAPCENVCPVNATNHSSEGLNQMIYNRCIGTRYCANNCPYKVRRFNWADYTGADSFPNNQDQKTVGKLDPAVFQMNDDLTRMVLNPDVVVRSRGVMEKCSFCVQRLQDGKLKAKKENRPLADMTDVQTACQQACPTNAIVFGNVNDSKTNISSTRAENMDRLYYVIEELHTLPNVNYLARVRHTEVAYGASEAEKEEAATEKHS